MAITVREFIEYLWDLPPDSNVFVCLGENKIAAVTDVISERTIVEIQCDVENAEEGDYPDRMQWRTIICPRWKYTHPHEYWENPPPRPKPGDWDYPIDPPNGSRSAVPPGEDTLPPKGLGE